MTGDDDLARQLGALRFTPRASLGPEIAGRVRRGEAALGDHPPRRAAAFRRWLGLAALVAGVMGVGAVLVARRTAAVADRCCTNLDGGDSADDGYVVEARGGRIVRLTLYEDLDGDRRLSAGDRVRLVRGAVPALGADSVAATVRVCCADLDGEGPADDGLLVLHGADERVVLAGVFERRGDARDATLR